MSPDASGAVTPTDDADADRARRALAAVWRIESARIVATLTRFVGDVGQAEDLAQEAMLEAMRQWPSEGVPRGQPIRPSRRPPTITSAGSAQRRRS